MGKLSNKTMREGLMGGRPKLEFTPKESLRRLKDDLGQSLGIEPVVVYASDLKTLIEKVKERNEHALEKCDAEIQAWRAPQWRQIWPEGDKAQAGDRYHDE